MARKFQPPEICPVCGEDVPRNAKACPECGADERTGWKEGAMEGRGLDLPDDEFDYDKFVAEEFGGGPKKTSIQWVWWVVAVVVFVACAVIILRHGSL
ncbi:MAG: zinc ribbon domain-containing protein [Verrucomicrobiaceae bacterium]|nr:MAG: zinc ribbon domain-containing protein [Verrucomicrobiaceae bacterium]